MKEKLRSENNLFIESVKNHQELVNILIEVKNEAGISQISQSDMARILSRSQAWVNRAIKKINTEDTCIEMITPEKYVIHYTDIWIQGVFCEIMKLIIECYEMPKMLYIKDNTIAAERNIKVKTVQMFKAYLRTGWKINQL